MQVVIHRKDDLLIAGLSGDWELDRPTPRFAQLIEERPSERTTRGIGFDTTELGTWDSSLLTFLMQGLGYCDAHDLEFRREGLPDTIVRLLELARAVPEADVERVVEETSFLAALGRKGLSSWDRSSRRSPSRGK
jgi:phospholipid/cholesterol/gamma-HCH transport system permease protein